jgi:hypothetical protein
VARKVFRPDRASSLVFGVLEGARNPYAWCRDAVEAAALRRQILERLVPLWFGERLRVPATYGIGWNREHRAYEMLCERIHGQHAPPPCPAGPRTPEPIQVLQREIMRPLQEHLEACGFDGLLWQAGRGNPVATGNFLIEDTADGELRWAWIDMESGVPALFALSPTAWLNTYLPLAARVHRAPFDDVDIPRLRRWLAAHAAVLEAHHGPGAKDSLLRDVDRLEHHQTRWKSLTRIQRALRSTVAAGRMTPERAWAWRKRPMRFQLWMALGAASRAARKAWAAVRRVPGFLLRLPYGRGLKSFGRFLVSQRYRAHLSRRLVAGRIRSWHRRGALGESERRRLRRELHQEETSAYVTDFGVHLMVKPFVKVLQWGVVPALMVAGTASQAVGAALIVGGGPLVRTVYTSGRLLQAWARRKPRPWIALGVGVFPVIGNAAYPAQLAGSSLGRDDLLARFLVIDVFAGIGRKVPIWGGKDTLTEHVFGRLPAEILDRLPMRNGS